jgi:hypothetical protein
MRDRLIGVKFHARSARSISRKISFSIREHSGKFFAALVLSAK